MFVGGVRARAWWVVPAGVAALLVVVVPWDALPAAVAPSPSLLAAGVSRVQVAPGVLMPLVSLGSGNHTAWIQLGGRGLDTAYDYGDASRIELGAAVRSSGVSRSELFVTDKVPQRV